MKTLLNTDDVIYALGGPTAVGKIVSRSAQAVNHWRVKNLGKFPGWTYLLIETELKRHGMTAPASLWGIQEPKRRRSANSEGAAA